MGEYKRLQYLDICKGILIILVVWGHCMPENSLIHKFIYSFHIPAFFIVSGMSLRYVKFADRPFLKCRGEKPIVRTSIQRLLISYFIYGGLLLFVRWCFSSFLIDNLIWQLKDLFFFTGIGATWFLPCLLLAQLMYWGIVKVDRKLKLRNIILISGVVFCLVVPFYVPNYNFITLVSFRSFVATAFILVGHFIIRVIEKISSFRWKYVFFVASFFIVIHIIAFCFTGKQDVALNVLSFKNPFIYILNALFGTGAVIIASICLEKIKWINSVFAFFGCNSLIVMGTHQILMLLLFIPIKGNVFLNALNCVILLLIESLLIFLIQYIKRKGFKKNAK